MDGQQKLMEAMNDIAHAIDDMRCAEDVLSDFLKRHKTLLPTQSRLLICVITATSRVYQIPHNMTMSAQSVIGRSY
jgi:hypothetical protein